MKLRLNYIDLNNFVSSIVKNKANNQVSLILKAKQLKKFGITPIDLTRMKFIKPEEIGMINRKVLEMKK